MSPPLAGAFRERPSKPTTFRKFYERREFPIALSHDTKGHRIAWKVGAPPIGNIGCKFFVFFLILVKRVECGVIALFQL